MAREPRNRPRAPQIQGERMKMLQLDISEGACLYILAQLYPTTRDERKGYKGLAHAAFWAAYKSARRFEGNT